MPLMSFIDVVFVAVGVVVSVQARVPAYLKPFYYRHSYVVFNVVPLYTYIVR